MTAPPTTHRVSPWELFRNGNYSCLWLAGGFIGTIRWLELLVISIYVYEVTGSPFLTALMTFFRLLPMVLLGAVIGAVAERLNRRVLMLCGLSVLMVTTTGLSALAYTGNLEIWHAALGAFLGGTVHTSEFPIRRIMVAEIAGSERSSAALAFDSLTNNLTRLVGPISGGVLYDLIGLYGAYTLCAVLYTVSFLLVWFVKYAAESQSTSTSSSYLTNIIEGFRFVRQRRMIVGTLCVTVIINMFAVPFSAMVPVIGKENLELSASLIGALATTEGVGAFLGAVLIALLQPKNFPRTYLLGSFLFLAGVAFFAQSNTIIFAFGILLVAGFGHAGFSTTQSAIIFGAAAPEMRSRMLGVLATSIGAGPLGVLHLGWLANMIGAPWALTIVATEGFVLLGFVAAIFPELFRGGPKPAGEKPVSGKAAE